MSKDSRSGGKFGGSHTTFIPAAVKLADAAIKLDEVTRVSSGIIKAGLKSVNGQRRVKFTDIVGGILLAVRDNTTYQEVRIYVTDHESARLALARAARSFGLNIAFGKSS